MPLLRQRELDVPDGEEGVQAASGSPFSRFDRAYCANVPISRLLNGEISIQFVPGRIPKPVQTAIANYIASNPVRSWHGLVIICLLSTISIQIVRLRETFGGRSAAL